MVWVAGEWREMRTMWLAGEHWAPLVTLYTCTVLYNCTHATGPAPTGARLATATGRHHGNPSTWWKMLDLNLVWCHISTKYHCCCNQCHLKCFIIFLSAAAMMNYAVKIYHLPVNMSGYILFSLMNTQLYSCTHVIHQDKQFLLTYLTLTQSQPEN